MLCDRTRSQLLGIDLQEKLIGAMPAEIAAQVIRRTVTLIEAAKALEIPMLFTEQYPQGLGPTTAAIATALPEDVTPLSKTCFSSCGANGSQAHLAHPQRRQFILTGMETHVCVLQTAVELRQRGLEVFVVQDAVCSRHKTNYQNALQRLQQAGVIVTNTESVLFEWLRDATHPQFKTLSKLIR